MHDREDVGFRRLVLLDVEERVEGERVKVIEFRSSKQEASLLYTNKLNRYQ